jgi:hypothetical protein
MADDTGGMAPSAIIRAMSSPSLRSLGLSVVHRVVPC